MFPLSNQEIYRIIDQENNTIEEFRKANPQFQIDTSNIASTVEEIEHFEQLYSNMGIGTYQFSPYDFEHKYSFKRVDNYTFQQLFSHNDNFESFLEHTSMNLNQDILDSVYKMMSCQDPSLGHAVYECPDCHRTFCVPFTCKSRFCNTCAIKYQMDRALEISSKLIRCEHRHITFTIPAQLRLYFFNDHKLLNILFKAAEECILFHFKKRAPLKKYIPGIILVLHTFGRDLKWNPHIHCLVTEGASSNVKHCSNDDIWTKFTHFDYEGFRKSFQYCLLRDMKDYLSKNLSPSDFNNFKKLVDSLYKNYDNGFYVRACPFDGSSSTDGVIKYLIRYFNRPAMAQSRILFFDDNYVVFYYQRHEDNMFVIEKIPIFDFFERLLIHIPDKNFKMLRYAGLYSSHKCVHFDKLIKKLSDASIKTKRQLANWRMRILFSFHYDPLVCPFCHSSMTLSEIILEKNTS